VARFLAPLQRYFGDLPSAQSSDPETDRYLLFSAVVGSLAAISMERPLVLLLEDLQWVDKPSLQLLRHLVASGDRMRLLVIGTYRDAELAATHPLTETLAALRREPDVHRLRLGGLSDDGVIAYLEAAAGGELNRAAVTLAQAIYHETDGNPFFVGEVLRHLVDTGDIVNDGGTLTVSSSEHGHISLPDSVREVIGARVTRLGTTSSRILSLASIIGREFDVGLLCKVADVSEDDALDLLDEVVGTDLIRELTDAPGRYTFSHALIQHTLYEDMGPTRRARGHRRVGEALESIYTRNVSEHLGELAHHWFNATQPSDVDKAVSYSRQAGEAALHALAPDDAVRLFTQALALVDHQADPDGLERIALQIGLGTAQRQSGRPEFRETLLDAARAAESLQARDLLAQAALANNRGFSPLGEVDQDRVAVLRSALRATTTEQQREKALLSATLCSELAWGSPLSARQELARQARESALVTTDPSVLVQVLNLTLPALFVPYLHDQQLEQSKYSLSLAKELDDPIQLFWAATFRHTFAVAAMEFGAAQECLDLIDDIAARVGQPVIRWHAASRAAAQALLRGESQAGLDLAEKALNIGLESSQPDALIFFAAQTLVAHLQLGRLQELEELIRQMVSDNPSMPVFRAAHALSLLESGSTPEANELLESAVDGGIAELPDDAVWLTTVLVYADLAIELRSQRASAYLFELLGAYDCQLAFQGAAPLDPVALYLGGLASVLDRHDEAARHLAAARVFAEAGNMNFTLARTELARARMLVGLGGSHNLSEARTVFLNVRNMAVVGDYSGIERRAVTGLSVIDALE
jgi:hypothetical protein